MKDKEFNLSEKEFGGDYRYGELLEDWTDTKGEKHYGKRAFWKEDVKEAVKKLKEEIKGLAIDNTDYYDNCNFRDFEEVIDKIFGDKLVEKGK